MILLSLLTICFLDVKHKAKFCEKGVELSSQNETSVSQNENMTKPLKEVLGYLCGDNVNRVIITHLNINSIRNKLFRLLNEGLRDNVDVIMISETKTKHFQQDSVTLTAIHLI